jgi:hypothetical protein
MENNLQTCLKKALATTQEKVRDFMDYSNNIGDEQLSGFFKECAETEGFQAQKLQEYLKEYS